MPIDYYDPGDERTLDVFRRAMDKFTVGSEEYELARKGFAFTCEKIRRRQKLDTEERMVELEIAQSLGN